jgi:Family of unknown function (DUF5677)
MLVNRPEGLEKVSALIENYTAALRAELAERWKNWTVDLTQNEVFEVIGGLLARQVTLATQLAGSPDIWNAHAAPLILRSMIDVYINLAWIFLDPLDRSRKFILHGLGQEKLDIEHRKKLIVDAGRQTDDDPVIRHKEEWLASQRFAFLTEVNVGAWSGIDTRKMAEEAGCLDFYRYAYTSLSAGTHSMWHHISRWNLTPCRNPLHRYHSVPDDPILNPDFEYLYLAAQYAAKTFDLFDEKSGVKVDIQSAFNLLHESVAAFGRDEELKPNHEKVDKP